MTVLPLSSALDQSLLTRIPAKTSLFSESLISPSESQ